MPVVAAGIGLAASTATTCELAVAAEAAGVDAVQIIAPRPGPLRLRDDELEAHFRAVVEAVRCDLHLSNNTALAGYELPIDLVERLVEDYPHIRAVNVSDPRVDELRAYVTRLVDGSRIEVRGRHGARDRCDARARRPGGVVLRAERRARARHECVGRTGGRRGAAADRTAPAAQHRARARRQPAFVESRAHDPRPRRRMLRAPYLPLPPAQDRELEAELRALRLP